MKASHILGLFAYEWYTRGISATPITYDLERYEMSKGIMIDLLIWIMPILYMGLRALLIIPMLKMIRVQ
jgi:hypothetical protein